MHGVYALTAGKWLLASLTALCAGISKTGIPALGILLAPLFAEVLPARVSTGALLPLLITADAFAVAFWRRHGSWKHLVRLLPWAIAGIVAGYFAMGRIDDQQMRYVMGTIVIAMLGVHVYREYILGKDAPIPTSWWFAAIAGFLAGATTMIANAAGPVTMIYLLSMRLPKNEFIGTAAWYFFILNWLKVPFSVNLGLITAESLAFDAVLAGGVVVGAFAGLFLAKRIPEKAFMIAVQILTLASAVKMFFLGLSMTELVVLWKAHHAGARRVTALADDLGVPPSTLTSVVDRLVDAGLLERDRDPDDRRAVVMKSTEKLGEQAPAVDTAKKAHIQSVVRN